MRRLAVLQSTLVALVVLGCGGDSANEPEAFATERVSLHITGAATCQGQPVEGAVIEYTVAPCPYFEDCDWRTASDTTDEQGRYAIEAARTCVLHESLSSWPADTVRGDFLSAYLPLSANGQSRSPDGYGPGTLLCTNSTQEFSFEFSHCP